MRSAVQRWCGGEREKEKQAAGSQMAGQWKHLFGPDWQIWRAGGWKLACHSSLQPGRCSCSLSSLLLHFSQYFWASAAQNVEFHSQSVNAIKARGSSSPWVFFFVFFSCSGFTVLWQTHTMIVFLPASLSHSFSALLHPRPPSPLKDEILILCSGCWGGRFQPSLPTSDPPDRQTKHTKQRASERRRSNTQRQTCLFNCLEILRPSSWCGEAGGGCH